MAKVKTTPDGYTSVTPHIVCKGVDKALAFYAKAFGAQETFRIPGPDGKTMHAEMRIGNATVMVGEECPEMGALSPLALKGTPVTLHIYVDNVDASFDRAVKSGATVKMPVTDMFWGDRYGQVADPFGHSWSIATHMKDLSPEQIMEGMKAQCGEMPAKK